MEYKSSKHKEAKEHILGKITKATFGFGGYQGAMIGLELDFETSVWSIGDGIYGGWAYGMIDPDKNTKWNEEDRSKQVVEMTKTICEILKDAKVDSISELVGKPIEIASEGWNNNVSWRILTEVL
jgi:hypothetical protein